MASLMWYPPRFTGLPLVFMTWGTPGHTRSAPGTMARGVRTCGLLTISLGALNVARAVLCAMGGTSEVSGLAGGMRSDREFADYLRRSLTAAAESVEPAGDGLERIRARLGRPWRPIGWRGVQPAYSGDA
jgi:hypothetical protein